MTVSRYGHGATRYAKELEGALEWIAEHAYGGFDGNVLVDSPMGGEMLLENYVAGVLTATQASCADEGHESLDKAIDAPRTVEACAVRRPDASTPSHGARSATPDSACDGSGGVVV